MSSIIMNELAHHDELTKQDRDVFFADAGDPEAFFKKEEKKNPLVIYHGNCADGFTAAWVFWDYARTVNETPHGVYTEDEDAFSYDFHAGVYNDPPPDVTGRVVYLVDFSYKREVVETMLQEAEKVILIDHHKTAIEDLLADGMLAGDYPNFESYTDLERSGAMLAWDYFHNYGPWDEDSTGVKMATIAPGQAAYKAPPVLLEHVQDRDLWKFKLWGTREIQANMFSFEYTFENWDMLMKDAQLVQGRLDMANAGAAIERKHHKDIAELVKVCQRVMCIGLHYVPVASLPYTLTSDAGHLMAKNYANGTAFAACYWDTETHRIFSLRSTEEGMDVSAIAKLYGGGGHKNAAGFRVLRDHELARV